MSACRGRTTGARRAAQAAGEKELLSDGKSSKRARRCLLLKQEPKYDATAAAVQSECKSRLMNETGDGGRSKTNGPIKSLEEAAACLLCVTG